MHIHSSCSQATEPLTAFHPSIQRPWRPRELERDATRYRHVRLHEVERVDIKLRWGVRELNHRFQAFEASREFGTNQWGLRRREVRARRGSGGSIMKDPNNLPNESKYSNLIPWGSLAGAA